MQFIHAREYLRDGQAIEVDCDTQCNVLLTTDSNFNSYQRRGGFEYFGGFRTRFPTVIRPPHGGHWNITIDLAGGTANIRYSIRVIG